MHLQILFLESPVLIMICNLYSNSGFFFYVLSSCGYSVLWCCNFINLKLLRWPWFLKICLFWTMVHPRCYAWGFWAWRAGATLWVACKGFFLQWLLSSWGTRSGARGLGHVGSVVAAHRFQRAGSVGAAHGLRCPRACGIFLPWPKIELIPCIARRILYHWTREAPTLIFL